MYLREHWARLNALQRLQIRGLAPIIMHSTAAVMLRPSRELARRFRIPRAVLREAFGSGSAHRAQLRAIEAPVRELLQMQPRVGRPELQG